MMYTERDQRFVAMINELLISLDRIAVSKGMGSSRAEAIRAIEAYQVNIRRFKKDYLWEEEIKVDEKHMEYEGVLIPIYRPIGEK